MTPSRNPFDRQQQTLEAGFDRLPKLPPITPRPTTNLRIKQAITRTATQLQYRRRRAWRPIAGAVAAAVALFMTLSWPTGGLDHAASAEAEVVEWLAAADTSEDYLANVLSDPWRDPGETWAEPRDELERLLDGLDGTFSGELVDGVDI